MYESGSVSWLRAATIYGLSGRDFVLFLLMVGLSCTCGTQLGKHEKQHVCV